MSVNGSSERLSGGSPIPPSYGTAGGRSAVANVRRCAGGQCKRGRRANARGDCRWMSTESGAAVRRRRNDAAVERTEVVIIGNGPSGICTSYMLSGHWPYYTGAPHPDEMLSRRLEDINLKDSLLKQNLYYLSDGLEGRTSNPVALLFDALSNPDADLGSKLPSLLRWEHHQERAIPHVVLGQQDEGGIWQTTEDHVQTLSLGEWMELPDLSFTEWRETYYREQNLPHGVKLSNRATAAEIRHYYSDYVDAKGLRQNFVNRARVTSVKQVPNCSQLNTDCESGEEDIDCGVCMTDISRRQLVWEVRGYQYVNEIDIKEFCYHAPTVVLATGAFDIPNKLRVRGETQPYVLYSVSELDECIQQGEIGPDSDPVVIVGAGLSAADAILRARAIGVPVVHVFRHTGTDPLAVFRQLPPALYPEYDVVHQLMRSGKDADMYRSYPSASIMEFTPSHEVLLRCENVECEVAVRASFVVVLIGSRPDLSFLHGDEKEIGVVPGMAVDGKRNPVDVDPYTYQSHRRRGLYAIGPLAGDNFVRFLRGGAFGVTASLWNERLSDEEKLYPFDTEIMNN